MFAPAQNPLSRIGLCRFVVQASIRLFRLAFSAYFVRFPEQHALLGWRFTGGLGGGVGLG